MPMARHLFAAQRQGEELLGSISDVPGVVAWLGMVRAAMSRLGVDWAPEQLITERDALQGKLSTARCNVHILAERLQAERRQLAKLQAQSCLLDLLCGETDEQRGEEEAQSRLLDLSSDQEGERREIREAAEAEWAQIAKLDAQNCLLDLCDKKEVPREKEEAEEEAERAQIANLEAQSWLLDPCGEKKARGEKDEAEEEAERAQLAKLEAPSCLVDLCEEKKARGEKEDAEEGRLLELLCGDEGDRGEENEAAELTAPFLPAIELKRLEEPLLQLLEQPGPLTRRQQPEEDEDDLRQRFKPLEQLEELRLEVLRQPSPAYALKARFSKVAIFGVHHSFTGALTSELKRFFNVTITNERFSEDVRLRTHQIFSEQPVHDEETLSICLVREPSFWIHALGRNPAGGSFCEIEPVEFKNAVKLQNGEGRAELYLTPPWSKHQLFDKVMFDHLIFPDALSMWEATVESYLSEDIFPPHCTAVLRCEDFLFRFDSTMRDLAARGLRLHEELPEQLFPMPEIGEDACQPAGTCPSRQELMACYGDHSNRTAGLGRAELLRLAPFSHKAREWLGYVFPPIEIAEAEGSGSEFSELEGRPHLLY